MRLGSRITSEYSAGGRAVHMGKGVTVRRSLHRKLVPAMQGRTHKPTSLRGIALSWTTRSTEASLIEEPGAGKPHAGICAGGVG